VPGCRLNFQTAHMPPGCTLGATRPAVFAVSSVLLPASFSAQASGSVADVAAAEMALPLPVEAWGDSVVALLEDGSSQRAARGDSAVALWVDDSSQQEARGDSAARRAEWVVLGGQHWARWRDGQWSASPACREALP